MDIKSAGTDTNELAYDKAKKRLYNTRLDSSGQASKCPHTRMKPRFKHPKITGEVDYPGKGWLLA